MSSKTKIEYPKIAKILFYMAVSSFFGVILVGAVLFSGMVQHDATKALVKNTGGTLICTLIVSMYVLWRILKTPHHEG